MAARRVKAPGAALAAACALVAGLGSGGGGGTGGGGGAEPAGSRARGSMEAPAAAAPAQVLGVGPAGLAPVLATAGSSQPGPSAAGPVLPVRVTLALTLTQAMRVGEVQEFVIGLGPDSGVAEVGFTVQLDGNVLQVRGAGAGGWGAGVGAHAAFDAVVADGEDRVQVRSVLTAARAGTAGGSVAVVQIQAVGTGPTTLQVVDLVLRDAAGRQLPASPGAANLQVSVDAAPPAPPRLRVPPSAPAHAAEAAAAEQGD